MAPASCVLIGLISLVIAFAPALSLHFFGLGNTRWKEIRIAATSTTVATPHWSARRKCAIGDDVDDEDDEIGQALHCHFMQPLQFGEV